VAAAALFFPFGPRLLSPSILFKTGLRRVTCATFPFSSATDSLGLFSQSPPPPLIGRNGTSNFVSVDPGFLVLAWSIWAGCFLLALFPPYTFPMRAFSRFCNLILNLSTFRDWNPFLNGAESRGFFSLSFLMRIVFLNSYGQCGRVDPISPPPARTNKHLRR